MPTRRTKLLVGRVMPQRTLITAILVAATATHSIGCTSSTEESALRVTPTRPINNEPSDNKQTTEIPELKLKSIVQRKDVRIEPKDDKLKELGVSIDEFRAAAQQTDCAEAMRTLMQERLEANQPLEAELFANVPIVLGGETYQLADVATVVITEVGD